MRVVKMPAPSRRGPQAASITCPPPASTSEKALPRAAWLISVACTCRVVCRASAFIRSSIEKIGPPGRRERGQAGAPRGLEAGERRAPLDREADRVGAAEQVDRELLPLELVGRALPAEAPRGLPARLDDQGQVRGGGLEPIPVGHVHLDAAAGATGPLVERGLERGGAEAHAGELAALERGGQPRAVEVGRADPLEGAGGAAALGGGGGPQEAAGRGGGGGGGGGH